MSKSESTQLHKGLKSIHVQMVALGGVIGSAYFYGIGGLIEMTGPGAFLAFGIGGILVFSVLYTLGEMMVAMPATGSFISYSREFISDGFAAGVGWTYWLAIVVFIPSECIVFGTILNMYLPAVPAVVWAMASVLIVSIINLRKVSDLGKMESVLAMTKIIAIVAFSILAILIFFGVTGTQEAPGISNILGEGGLFPLGVLAIFMNMSIVVMNYGGTELIALTAGETPEPEKVMPKAVRAGAYRIFFLFIIPAFLVSLIFPWTEASYEESAFSAALAYNGFGLLSHIFNFVIVIAALSCANCNTYATIRALYSLSKEGMAPKMISAVNRGGVPVRATISTLIIVWIVLFLYAFDESGLFYMYLLSISGVATVFCWGSICISQWVFRRRLLSEGLDKAALKFHTPWCPLPNILGLLILLLTLILTACNKELRLSLYIGIPCFIVPFAVFTLISKKGKYPVNKEIDYEGFIKKLKQEKEAPK